MAKTKTTTRKTAPKKNGTTKAQSIRDIAKELGKKARPRDIIAALAEKGITVTSPQVSMTLKAAGMRRGRRRRKVVAAVAVKRHSGNGHGLDINELVQVKKLADQLGGTAKLKELAAALERLG
jgi:arginine repressor